MFWSKVQFPSVQWNIILTLITKIFTVVLWPGEHNFHMHNKLICVAWKYFRPYGWPDLLKKLFLPILLFPATKITFHCTTFPVKKYFCLHQRLALVQEAERITDLYYLKLWCGISSTRTTQPFNVWQKELSRTVSVAFRMSLNMIY